MPPISSELEHLNLIRMISKAQRSNAPVRHSRRSGRTKCLIAPVIEMPYCFVSVLVEGSSTRVGSIGGLPVAKFLVDQIGRVSRYRFDYFSFILHALRSVSRNAIPPSFFLVQVPTLLYCRTLLMFVPLDNYFNLDIEFTTSISSTNIIALR